MMINHSRIITTAAIGVGGEVMGSFLSRHFVGIWTPRLVSYAEFIGIWTPHILRFVAYTVFIGYRVPALLRIQGS
jgi:hypothetical protein